MTLDHLRVLVDFHAWQGERLLEAAAGVPPETLLATPLNDGTLFDALRHVLDVNFSWRRAAEGLSDPGLVWEVEPLDDFASVRGFWTAEDERLRNLVSVWAEDDVERLVTPPWRQQPFSLCRS